jgi:transposase
LFKWWHRIRDGTLTRAAFAQAVVEIRGSGPSDIIGRTPIQRWLAQGAAYEPTRGEKSARARTARTCRELLKVEQALWLFVHVEGIEPTNNAAERALRPAVI